MAIATIPGFPRIGANRELKWALEAYWAGKRDEAELLKTAADLRRTHWQRQIQTGLDLLPVNDFSLYDQVLDTIALVGAVPGRFNWDGGQVGSELLFAMARGRTGDRDARAMEMTKWFDTNYHYLVPELAPDQSFRLSSDKPFAELREAVELGIAAKPVLLGPISFLMLGKSTSDSAQPLKLLDRLIPAYAEIVSRLAALGTEWIQFDEPILVTDLGSNALHALKLAYRALAGVKGEAKLLLQTSYGHVGDAYPALSALPVDAIGLDFTRGPETLDLVERFGIPGDKWLSVGLVDGRNVWVNDLDRSLATLHRLSNRTSPDRLMVSTSCSLLHVPYGVAREDGLDPQVRPWLAFAEQKLAEVVTLTRALNEGENAVSDQLEANRAVRRAMVGSTTRHNSAVRDRLAALPPDADRRLTPYAKRAVLQRERLSLPILPTTTIGSFPQTPELRTARQRWERGDLDDAGYESTIAAQIRDTIVEQERLGLDMLVHGEPERNDMVQYFGEQLDGFAFTHHGWVQSYGSRCVRPPIIYGDVQRPAPMTVRWATYAQSLTTRPVKGMLTGPVTILNWSFVRDDQPRSETCLQIALAIRDEVVDLDAAGIAAIQIDEPALREGLPLRRSDWARYLEWATASFRISAAGARDETQIHTHMCYSEFGEIIDAISALDADVISIEHARSDNELLRVFRHHGYDKEIGPGVYDIHSPRVPTADEMSASLRATLDVLDPAQVWVNPDCGLKTRRWEEVRPALANMVAAAHELRAALVTAAG